MAYPIVAVTGDPVPSDWQVNITLEVVEQFTEHSPARLRTEFMNEAPTTRTFLSGLGPPFGPLVGHTESGERILLNDSEATDCLPLGEYRFEAEWGERYEDNEDVYHSWGFTLVLR